MFRHSILGGIEHLDRRLGRCESGDLVMSAVTLGELEVGFAKSGSPDLARSDAAAVLSAVGVMPFDEDAARVFGRVQAGAPGSQRRLALNDAIANAEGRPVDLVDLQRAGPRLLTQSLTRGKRIVKRDSGVLARLLVKMWYLNADLMPLVRMIQDMRLKRFLRGR